MQRIYSVLLHLCEDNCEPIDHIYIQPLKMCKDTTILTPKPLKMCTSPEGVAGDKVSECLTDQSQCLVDHVPLLEDHLLEEVEEYTYWQL